MHTLDDWLQHWLSLADREIVMGLDRVGAVWCALGAPAPAAQAISVAGTNGKGSTVAFIDAMLRAGGYRVGRYTSPHLRRYQERVAIDGVAVDADTLVAAFARIEAARGTIPLTYFEAGTLAALLIFADAGLDVAVLEVGLGGRLDAVNLIDADVALITTIDLDHQALLGDSREAIAVEKAGILRRERVAVIGERDPPASLLAAVAAVGAHARYAGRDFDWRALGADAGAEWEYRGPGGALRLPAPAMAAAVQRGNAACAVSAVHALAPLLHVPDRALAEAVASTVVPGRLQRVASVPEIVLDVGHNPQAARALSAWLTEDGKPTDAVFGVLADKDVEAIVAALRGQIQVWYLCSLDALTPRGLGVAALAERLRAFDPGLRIECAATPAAALAAALAAARRQGAAERRILGFGSFYLVAALQDAIPV
ncbi:MAG: folylpolyglutamate synthase/dihydrofolate synthase family protein [Lysobacterales bacterium]